MARLDGWNYHTRPVDTEQNDNSHAVIVKRYIQMHTDYLHARVGITRSLGFTKIVVHFLHWCLSLKGHTQSSSEEPQASESEEKDK